MLPGLCGVRYVEKVENASVVIFKCGIFYKGLEWRSGYGDKEPVDTPQTRIWHPVALTPRRCAEARRCTYRRVRGALLGGSQGSLEASVLGSAWTFGVD